jgi:hypothetical protein
MLTEFPFYDVLCTHLNILVPKCEELLDYWASLKVKLEPFLKDHKTK